MLFPSIPKVINQVQLLDFIAMMNLVQQKTETRDVTKGPATVSSPRTVVRKSLSPPPPHYERDRVPDRSRSPVRKSPPTGRTDRHSQRYSFEESSESPSRSQSWYFSRSPDRRPDSPLDFRAAIQSEETAKSSSVSDSKDDGGSSKKVSSVQYELFRQAVTSSKGFQPRPRWQLELHYWISAMMKRQTECRGWTSLHCQTLWCLQPGSIRVRRTKNLWRKQHFLRCSIQTARLSSWEPYRLKMHKDAQYQTKPPTTDGFGDWKPPANFQISQKMAMDM